MIEIDLQALSKLISYTHILIYYLLNQVYTGPHSVNFEWFITTFIYNNRG